MRQHGGVTYAEPAGKGAAPESQAGPFGIMIEILRNGGAVVLSGAGLSTESGIPDYRGPSGRARRAQPMTYQVFTGSAAARQRYWARSHLGWRHITGAAPNAGHRAVAALERGGLLRGIITPGLPASLPATADEAIALAVDGCRALAAAGQADRVRRRGPRTRSRR
jgi:hypothetical protein